MKVNKKNKGQSHLEGKSPISENLGFGKVTLSDNRKRGSSEQIVTRIIEKANAWTRKDIKDWLNAIKQSANKETPRRILLQNLYDILEVDNHISGLMDHSRKNKLLAQPFRIVDSKTGKEDIEKTKIFQSPWFTDFIELYVESVFKGHTVIQLGDIVEMKYDTVTLIPRRHIIPEFGQYLIDQTDQKGYPYRETPFMKTLIEVGKPTDLGLFKKAAPSIIFKKNAMMAWSEYCEIFGMPLRVGKTNSRSTADQARMADGLKKMGTATYAVFNEGETIEFIESTKGDAFNVYDKLIERCNSELSKLVVGQTMTTDNGSSKSQGEVHERLGNDVTESDKRSVAAIVNSKLIPKMIEQGFPLKGNDFQYPEKKDIDAIWKRTYEALEYYDVEDQFIIDTFGIPVTGKKQAPMNTPEKKKPKLKDFSLMEFHLSMFDLYGPPDERSLLTIDPTFDAIIERIAKLIHEGKLKPTDLDKELLQKLSDYLFKGVTQGFGKGFEDVKIGSKDYGMLKELEKNVYVFSGFKTYTELKEMTMLLKDENDSFKTFNEFLQDVRKVNTTYNKNYLKAEHIHAVRCSNLASTWLDIQKEKKDLPFLEFDAIGDKRTTPICTHLDKVIRKVDDPFWDKYYPPLHWRCRSSVRQHDEDAEETDMSKVHLPDVKPMFEGNVGKDKIIFPDTHPYFEASGSDKKKVMDEVKKGFPKR